MLSKRTVAVVVVAFLVYGVSMGFTINRLVLARNTELSALRADVEAAKASVERMAAINAEQDARIASEADRVGALSVELSRYGDEASRLMRYTPEQAIEDNARQLGIWVRGASSAPNALAQR